MNKRINLRFAAGAGMPPPVLTGRECEKDTIKEALDDLSQGFNPTANIALIGPRGCGKTVLLRWAETHVDRQEGDVKCLDLNPDCFRSHSDLVGALADQEALSTLADDGFSASINLYGSGIGLSRQEAAKKLLRPVLESRCSRSGLAIFIDEAHTLDRHADVVRTFFYEVQYLAGNGRPLLLILAGTPSISTRLATIDATYWDRLNKVGIGLLDLEAALEALQTPLERLGYRIKPDILDEAVDAAQCYPYFLQAVGNALHRAAKAEPGNLVSGKRIGSAILDRALKEFHVKRKNYYSERYKELEREGILTAAEAVARLFVSQEKKSLSSDLIKSAIKQSFGVNMENAAAESKGKIDRKVQNADAKLRQVGIVWSQIGQEEFCEPGIPSLMDYVAERARDRARAEADFR